MNKISQGTSIPEKKDLKSNPRSIFKARADKVEYTMDQKSALLLVDRFMMSPDNFFLLAGNAGTGKTTIAENIVNHCNANILAPTNAALKRLKDKFLSEKIPAKRFTTIHQAIYGTPDPISGEFKQRTGLSKAKVYIIDEASMVDTPILNDLIKTALKDKVKLIFIGDDFQLEPVGKDPQLFKWENSPGYLVFKKVWKTKLNEVVRNEGVILEIATHLRNNSGVEILNKNKPDFSLVKMFSNELLLDIQHEKDFIVIVSTNKTRMKYNQHIRQAKFEEDSKSPIVDGEKLISVSNQRFLNGEHYTIINSRIVDEFEEIINVGSKKYPKTGKYKLFLVEHEVVGQEGTFKTLVVPNLDKPSLHPDMLMECPVFESDDRFTTNKLNIKRMWNKNVNIATYGYATSAHKSQGNEWENVYIDANWLSDSWNKARWMYTAITRATKKVELKISNQFQIIDK
tara:strand:+ start:3844 stop:5211 length:1368 start_codon:yes stop_codon:yes gene_type:complete